MTTCHKSSGVCDGVGHQCAPARSQQVLEPVEEPTFEVSVTNVSIVEVPDELGNSDLRPPASIAMDCALPILPKPVQPESPPRESAVIPPEPPSLAPEGEHARAAALEAQLRQKEVELLEEKARSAALESRLASLASGGGGSTTPETPATLPRDQAEGPEARRPYSQPPPRHPTFASPAKGEKIEEKQVSGSLPPSPQTRPPPGTWASGVFDMQQTRPRQLAVRTLAKNFREAMVEVLQGAPCCMGSSAEVASVGKRHDKEDAQPRLSLGEVRIAEIASPQRQRRRRAVEWATAKAANSPGAQKGNIGAILLQAAPAARSPGSHSESGRRALEESSPPGAPRKKSKSPGSVARKAKSTPQATPQAHARQGSRTQNSQQAQTLRSDAARTQPDSHGNAVSSARHGSQGTREQEPQLSARSTPAQGAQRSHASSPSSSQQAAPAPAAQPSGQGGGFLDDVRLRADAARARQGAKPGRCASWVMREKCDFLVEEERGTAVQPFTSRGSPRGDRIWTARQERDSPEDVILDLSNILQGCPADGSLLGNSGLLGNSLDESMMGASVDESFCGRGVSVPDLPQPKLAEYAPAVTEPEPRPEPAPPQPQRTVFFPAPPVHASSRVYHAGHYQGWSQRSDGSRSLSPKVFA